ncbi:lytic transglycosylase domain-containing protein [Streptomyces sp. NPDC001262]|uniref:lytic transglycosylase domain-containing protein n=1 Tax=Streptomyces sp. NPDC001262 TaxID=3364552 RepID=UPI0036B58899
MKFVTPRTRRGLCGVALAASLSTAAAAGPLTASADPAAPGQDSPQAAPSRGVPNLALPDLRKPGVQPGPSAAGDAGIPATALDAYKKAAEALAGSQPGCRIPWELVAGIGRVESVHASGYGLREDGSTETPIRGPRLDGKQFALIRDTDGGRWDGDTEYDRAVGPTQFIPSTWAAWGADGNGDGVKDPNNIYDAALGTARYLCAGDRDLDNPADLDRAILSYNNSREYVNAVMEWMRTYQGGNATAIPNDTPANPHRPDPAVPRVTAVSVKSGAGSTVSRPVTPVPTPQPKPDPKPDPTPVPKPTPDLTPTRLDVLGSDRIGAETGQVLRDRFRVRSGNRGGQAVPRQDVTFEIVGDDTDARFPGGGKSVTVATDGQGIAVAPPLHTGDRPGTFTVRGRAAGRDAGFQVTLRLPATATADLLRVAGERPLSTVAGTEFPGPVRIEATRHGQPALGTRITATLDGSSDEAPYFTDADGAPVRTLVLPAPGSDGLVTLPVLHAGRNPGTYVLRLTTPEGVTLDVPLTVMTPES